MNKLEDMSYLSTNDFYMVYQPKFKNDVPVSAEALFRLRNSNIPIGDYLSKVTDTTLFDIGIISRVIFDINHNSNIKNVSANIYPESLLDNRFIDYVKSICSKINFDLTLELIETKYYLINEELINAMLDLKNVGIRFSLDDFGKDFSNDNALISLPISEVKVDGSLIDGIEDNFLKFKYLKFLNEMVSNLLNVNLVFEKVENIRQLELIKLINKNAIIQGYHLSMPLCLSDLDAFSKLNEIKASIEDFDVDNLLIDQKIFDFITENISKDDSLYQDKLNKFINEIDHFGIIGSENIHFTMKNYKKVFLSNSCYINNMLTNLLKNNHHLIIIRNSHGIVVYDNEAHQQLVGSSLVGKYFEDITFSNNTYAQCLNKDKEFLDSEKSFITDVEEFNNKFFETIREKIILNGRNFVMCSIYEISKKKFQHLIRKPNFH